MNDHHKETEHEPSAHLGEDVGADPLLTRLAQNDPLRGEDLTGWAESGEGQETFSRLLARRPENAPNPKPKSQRRRFFAGRRMWYALVGAAVVVAALVTVVVLGTEGPAERVALSPTSTVAASAVTTTSGFTATTSAASVATTAAPAVVSTTSTLVARDTPSTEGTSSSAQVGGVLDRPVRARGALIGVVRLARLATGKSVEGTSAPSYSGPVLLKEAVAAGVLSDSQAASLDLNALVTRGGYALWMWRAIGPHLPTGVAVAGLRDIASLSAEEQKAIAGLAAAGIVRGGTNRDFYPNRILTQGEEQQFVGRAEAALRLR